MGALSRVSAAMKHPIVDLFAGPGGWDVAAHELGLEVLGIEWDDAACATRRAAGFPTLQADIAGLDPLDFAPIVGLIASPPCQAWSMAGKGGGRRDKDLVVQCAGDLAAGTDSRAELRARCEDERSILAVEPLRWALALRPEWCAFEQVPPVLELWTMFAQILALEGYSTWAGVLEAERYGVPQTRERAILLARRDGPVEPPRPTHQRYVPGEPQRHEITLEGDILPWVSMAEALGWEEGEVPSPAPSVTGGGGETGGVEVFAGKGSRERARRAVGERWVYNCDGAPPSGLRPNAPLRTPDLPAPTIRGGNHNTPAWVRVRPAPTIVGGHHEPGQQSKNAVRVTVEEAAALQTFPPGYPWQGSRSKQFLQIGNAVPPLLAWHILRAIACRS